MLCMFPHARHRHLPLPVSTHRIVPDIKCCVHWYRGRDYSDHFVVSANAERHGNGSGEQLPLTTDCTLSVGTVGPKGWSTGACRVLADSKGSVCIDTCDLRDWPNSQRTCASLTTLTD